MLNIKDLYWLAGFLEGEGSFTWYSGKTCNTLNISVAQKQLEPITRVKNIVGNIGCISKRYAGVNKTLMHTWKLCGPNAVGLCMTLWELMSPRRKKQIEKALIHWQKYPHKTGVYQKKCKNNIHEWVKENQFQIGKNNVCGPCYIKIHPRSKKWVSQSNAL